MPDGSALLIFVAAAGVLLITPGPAVLYIVTRSVDQGRLAGIVSVLGIGVGGLFHIAAAAFGLSALLMSSALAFNVVKYLGAAYLLYLGVRKLLVRETIHTAEGAPPKRLSRIFSEGVVVNLLNPKTALFFFAFLPQFVDPARGPVAIQILLLGALFTLMAVTSDGAYALLAGSFGQWLKSNTTFLRFQPYVTGGIYITLGLTAAFSGSNRK